MKESDVEELLSHLHDEIETLSKNGLSQEESFWIARYRLGDSKTLREEYSKVNRPLIWYKNALLLLLGYFLFTLIPKIVGLLTLPIYIMDLKWMLFTTPIMGSEYPVPIPLFLLTILLIGGMFYLGIKQKICLNNNMKRFFDINSGAKIRYNFIIYLLGIYVTINIGRLPAIIAINNHYAPNIAGFLSASEAMFSLLWTPFLIISLILILVSLFRENKDKIISKEEITI